MPASLLRSPELRADLALMVRRRVPESDVDDVLQATLTDALAAREAPEDPERLRRWLFGIARHKIVDLHRSRKREVLAEEEPAAQAFEAPPDELLRWAERELPTGNEARSTLRLMLREGDGEPLEVLADEANVPAATLRQRVSRLRRHFRERWALQVAMLASFGLLVLGGIFLHRFEQPSPLVLHPWPDFAHTDLLGVFTASPASPASPVPPAPSALPVAPAAPSMLPSSSLALRSSNSEERIGSPKTLAPGRKAPSPTLKKAPAPSVFQPAPNQTTHQAPATKPGSSSKKWQSPKDSLDVDR